MTIELIIKLLFTIIFMCSVMTVTFVLFRIPIKNNLKQVALLGFLVGIVNFYFKFILNSPYVFLFQTIVIVILLMVIRGYPLLYSLVVSITGFIFVSLLDAVVTLGALQLNLTTTERMSSDLIQFILFHLIVTALCLIVSYVFVTRKIGFSFIVRRFSGKYSLKISNFIWAIFLILCTVALQLTSIQISNLSLHVYIIIFIAASLIFAILYAIKRNKDMIRDRYSKDFINKGK